MLGDVGCVKARDPAARHTVEILITYPGVHAVLMHRIAHRLWRRRWRFPARVLAWWARVVTNVDIHPGAQIGQRLFIDHGAGVVIGETAQVGDDVTLYHGVTLGGTSWSPGAHYVDPALVIVACLIFVVPPMRMIRKTFIELVEGSPDTDLVGPAKQAVDEVCERFALGEQHLRMTKVGRKFYVEIDFVVDPSWNVRQSDEVRRALTEKLNALPHDLWLTVEFTADRSWGE